MIAGIGVDHVSLPEFREQLSDGASSFVEGTFTAGERRGCEGRASGDPGRHLAARFAAKEAFIKAWSGSRWGLSPVLGSVDMRDIEVETDRWGRPRLVLRGELESAVVADGPYRLHVSLTHDGPTAAATVILERDSS